MQKYIDTQPFLGFNVKRVHKIENNEIKNSQTQRKFDNKYEKI